MRIAMVEIRERDRFSFLKSRADFLKGKGIEREAGMQRTRGVGNFKRAFKKPVATVIKISIRLIN